MINQRPRHILGIVKNLAEPRIPGMAGMSVKRATACLSTAVILDRYGCIRACGQQVAALAGIPVQTLSGQPIKSLLPALPFQPGTPGYNVAFAVFLANTRQRAVCKITQGTGAPAMVDVSLSLLETAPDYLFRLDIRTRTDLSVLPADAGVPVQWQLFQHCADPLLAAPAANASQLAY